jgi:hypothetical protein
MVCVNCTKWAAPSCRLNPYPVMIAPGPLPHNLELIYGYIEASPITHWCSQGSWKEKYEHINLWHVVKWGEWEDEDEKPHVQSYHDYLISKADAYRKKQYEKRYRANKKTAGKEE